MLETLPIDAWIPTEDGAARRQAVAVLEAGGVLLLPRLAFAVEASEQRFLDPDISDGNAKNVSYEPQTGRSGGTRLEGAALTALNSMIGRFAGQADSFLRGLLPSYATALERARTSFRPCEVESRPQNARKDDRRLHIDAFPSQPVQGRRILRLFSNVNSAKQPRVWQVGEPFEAFAARFLPHVSAPLPGSGRLLDWLGITKGRRTAYDHMMLQLHDLAKLDDDYQRAAPRSRIDFAAGATWLVFTDTVLHAALAGQHIFEQTFILPVEAMQDQSRAPLRILERLGGRRLA